MNRTCQESAHLKNEFHNTDVSIHRLGGCHHHPHVDVEDTSGKRLLITLALNFIIPVAQVVGGIISNSVALVSDALHNFSDFTAVLISYIAFRIGRKGPRLKTHSDIKERK